MVKHCPMLGTFGSTKTKCIKLIFIGKITLVPVAFLMALSIYGKKCILISFKIFKYCFYYFANQTGLSYCSDVFFVLFKILNYQ